MLFLYGFSQIFLFYTNTTSILDIDLKDIVSGEGAVTGRVVRYCSHSTYSDIHKRKQTNILLIHKFYICIYSV